MKVINCFLMGMIFWAASPAGAEVYRYVDDKGIAHFTNDLSTIPDNKLPEVVERREDPRGTAGEASVGVPLRSPTPGNDPEEEIRKAETFRKKKLNADKAALEAEYGRLLKDKADIDNDTGFQKRRDKRKYKHRPQIEARVKEEEGIKKRLAEIEQELKNIESQL